MNRTTQRLGAIVCAGIVALAVSTSAAHADARIKPADTKWQSSPSSAAGSTMHAAVFPGVPAPSCAMPAPVSTKGVNWLQWSPTTHRSELGQDTFFRFSPVHPKGGSARDLIWVASPSLGKLYTRVVYRDAKNVCRMDGHALVRYGVLIKDISGVASNVPLTRIGLTWRPEWKQLVGVEISVLPLQPTAKYYASWMPQGNRTQVAAPPQWLVEHGNNPAPTMWKVGTATQLHWVVNPAYHPFVQVTYIRSGVRHTVTDRTLTPVGTLDILLPRGSVIVATLVQGS